MNTMRGRGQEILKRGLGRGQRDITNGGEYTRYGKKKKKSATLVTCQDSRELFKPQLLIISSRQSQHCGKHSLHSLRPTRTKKAGSASNTKHSRQQIHVSTTRMYFSFPSTMKFQ